MGTTIGSVIELVCPHSIIQRLRMSPGLVIIVLRVVEGNSGHRVDLGTEKAQKVDFALRLGVGHVDNQLVTSRAAHMGEADSRVPRSPLDDGTASPKQTSLLSIFDHIKCSTIFDAASGVLELGFS